MLGVVIINVCVQITEWDQGSICISTEMEEITQRTLEVLIGLVNRIQCSSRKLERMCNTKIFC